MKHAKKSRKQIEVKDDPRIAALQSALSIARRQTVKVARAMLRTELLLARREGYIERVQELDTSGPITEPTPLSFDQKWRRAGEVSAAREALLSGSESDTARMLDEIDPSLLDEVLGKPDIPVES